jgi:small-conductance mechanosensitive channel
VYPVLALILLGVAIFTAVVSRGATRILDQAAREHLQGFGYVGAAALALLAVVVVVVGMLGNAKAQAETIAMIGFFAFVVYVVVAYLITIRVAPRLNPSYDDPSAGSRFSARRTARPAATAPVAAPAAPAPNRPSRTAFRPVR